MTAMPRNTSHIHPTPLRNKALLTGTTRETSKQATALACVTCPVHGTAEREAKPTPTNTERDPIKKKRILIEFLSFTYAWKFMYIGYLYHIHNPLSSPPAPPSSKWLQLSGPQIGTAGTGLARCPPPSRVCLRERKPAHLWNPSLSPRSASPTCPRGAWGQPPCSVSLFPSPSPITMRVVFTVALLSLHQSPSCLRAHGLPVLPPPPQRVSYLSSVQH